MKFTRYFEIMRQRPDRSIIKLEWIRRPTENPVTEVLQADGRYLRVVLLEDGETVHSAFFDRRFTV